MKCPKCGHDNREDSLFCEQCGQKLDEKMTCPNCGAEVNEGAAFCASCGQKLGESQTTTTVSRTNTGFKPPVSWLRSITLTLLGFGIGLMVAGMFCGMLHQEISQGSASQGKEVFPIAYIFKDMWKEFDLYRQNGLTGMKTAFSILGVLILISYILMLVGVISFGAYAVINAEKKGKEKTFVLKGATGIIACTLPYVLLTIFGFCNSTTMRSYKITQSISMGFGLVILIIGMLIVLGSIILNKIENNKNDRKEKVAKSNIFYGLASFTFVVVLLLGFGSFLSFKNSGSTGNAGIFTRLTADITRKDLGDTLSKGFGINLFAVILAIGAIIIATVTLPNFVKKQDKSSGVGIIVTSLFILASMILGLCSGKITISSTDASTFVPGATFYLYIVFALITACLVVLGAKNENKKAN